MIGTTLSHYKVFEKIGQGGMGEVYRAEDTNLSREVAIKVLPEQFTQDPQQLARFEREAKLLAQLNHPNIAAIYGFEKAEGVHFLALELVKGETLAEWVAKGPLPVEEALKVCRQIAEGVEAAHEKGVIHRDLKPANVKVTPEGKVKILDFGLAKAFEEEIPAEDMSQSPTLTEEMTRAGVILGTAAYMSPEQAKGKAVDKRTDIFAFGAVLYELLTGKRAFQGETISETIARVLMGNPDWEVLPQDTPIIIRSLLRRCLQKDSNRRLQHIGDARIEIEEGLEEPAMVSSIEVGRASPLLKRAIPWSIAIAAVIVATLALWQSARPTPTPTPLLKFKLPLAGEPAQNSPMPAAISPNGTMVAYIQDRQLWIHRLDELEPREIPSTLGADQPFWSPNSDFVGYYDQSAAKLKKVAVQGGPPITIGDLPAGFLLGATWGSDDTIVFASDWSGLFEISAQGDEPQLLLEVDGTKHEDWAAPLFLEDGRILCVIWKDGNSQITYVSEGMRQTLFEIPQGNVYSLSYSPTGHLVYQKSQAWLLGGGIWAVPFDLETLEATGDPFLVEQEGRGPSVSSDGTLTYLSRSSTTSLRQLVWVDRNGEVLGPIGQPQHQMGDLALSRDGTRVGVSALEDGNADVWIHDVERGTRTRLTTHNNFDFEPTFSPTGDEIAFASDRNGTTDIIIKAADGSGQIRSLATGGDSSEGVPDWSRDGKHIAYFVNGAEAYFDLGYLSLAEDAKPAFLFKTPFHENEPAISPDSRYIAYTSNESGRWEVYISSFPEGDGRSLVSVNGGMHPQWNGRGDELFYKEADALMVVKVNTRTEFEAGVPQKLFDRDEVSIRLFDDQYPLNSVYDVNPDGQKFVMFESLEEEANLIVVLNWFEELKRLVPTN